MRSTWLIRATRSAVVVALLAATVGASVATAKPAPDRGGKRRGANLFALVFGVMNVNHQFCGINNIGELCVDPTNSPVVGGGFWPKGTPDRNTISQEDLWVRTWDGNPALLSGRTHPMGVLVEERGMAWNYPTGNEDIIYFVFTFTNVTSSKDSIYNSSPSLAYLPQSVRDEIIAIGKDYQNRNEARFNVAIPDNGYKFSNLLAAVFMDPD